MEAFASGGGPAATWSDEELAVTECGKLIAQASSLRELRRNGGGHAALEPSKLQARWVELNLPGSPPNEEELAWAVTAVTSRAYTVEEGGSEGGSTDGSTVSGMIPMVCARTKRPLTHTTYSAVCTLHSAMPPTPTLTRSAASVRVRVCTTLLMPLVQVDMANHNGVQPPKTAKGLEPGGEHFVVLATQAFAKGEIGGAWICKRAPNIVTHPAVCEHRHSLSL